MRELRLSAETVLDARTTEIMGVVNVTPDSFSDGGTLDLSTPEARTASAVQRALQLVDDGASIIDIGGESTRPGATRVPQPEELARVLPVVEALAGAGILLSIDTMYAATASACLDVGDVLINDVSGGLADPEMLPLVAERGATFILSHWRGHSIHMNDLANYADPAAEVRDELAAMRDRALAAGIEPERIILDPGLGFAKTGDDDWAILRGLGGIQGLGHRVLVGPSRKRFVGALLPEDAPMTARDLPTAVLAAMLAERGVWGVRVHNAAATRVALDAVVAWQQGSRSVRGVRGVRA